MLPDWPVHVVIFRSKRRVDNEDLYAEWSQRMEERVRGIEGYIDHVEFRDPETREGVTLAYFDSEEAIARWREDAEHRQSQELGRTHFHEGYTLEVAEVQRRYPWTSECHPGS